jgi:3'5'-cyclic nucleotide phosphodiesterase
LRNARWDRAFKKDGAATSSEKDSRDRKATIVIEHLIQASDVAHTMQHWHVYRQWNERLFRECYKAWKEGRAEKDPTEFWYKGEIGFYDFYIIPLAKKLKECGVFGVSSSEYLDYAMSNRAEWEEKGEEAVQEMVANVKAMEEKVLKKQAQAQEKWLTAEYGNNDDSVAGSSGMISFDSRASLGFLGPFEKN